ncbi:unnamed protein product [Closterium sp. NIES-65]|nr:unnamed protein product [Closterium sp. NIES-65]
MKDAIWEPPTNADGGGGGAGGGGGGGGGGEGGESGLGELSIEEFAAMEEDAGGAEDAGPPDEVRQAQQQLDRCFRLVETAVGLLTRAGEKAEGGEAVSAERQTNGVSLGHLSERQLSVKELSVREQSERLRLCTELVDGALKDVLVFLQLAQQREWWCGEAVVACVRVAGACLAAAPSAHRKRAGRLLGFLLAVTGAQEERPLLAVQYMLPALVHITSEPRGCTSLVKRGGHIHLIDYMVETARTNMHHQLRSGPEGQTSLMQAADVILNILACRKQMRVPLDPHDFVSLLPAMAGWSSVKGNDPRTTYKTLALAACVNASILELSCEDVVKKRLDLATYKKLPNSFGVIVKFLEFGHRNSGSFSSETEIKELWDITVASCTECLPLWPQLKRAMVKSEYWGKVSRNKLVTRERLNQVCKDARLRELLAVVAFSP